MNELTVGTRVNYRHPCGTLKMGKVVSFHPSGVGVDFDDGQSRIVDSGTLSKAMSHGPCGVI